MFKNKEKGLQPIRKSILHLVNALLIETIILNKTFQNCRIFSKYWYFRFSKSSQFAQRYLSYLQDEERNKFKEVNSTAA